ncbi:MAG: hypothetical protein E6G68_01235 [Actinobacteria bacterium]|nr:MAG: hypothetical protein E6G68_01235 [Actinomycetota bacterium]
MRRLAFVVVLLVALSGCGKDFFDPTPGRSGGSAPTVELFARNVSMMGGGQNAVRISFRPKDPSVRLRIERSSSDGRVVACPLRTIADPLPPVDRCIPDVPDGVRENLTTPGLGAIALVREGTPISIELRLSYEEGGRAFLIRIPIVRTPPGAATCKDNACNPIFELAPLHTGRLTATATWIGGPARLELLEGRIQARAFSSTGIPYGIVQTRTGAPPLPIGTEVTAPSEYALALSDASPSDITHIEIGATWP